jgi:hypothetical protein
MLLAGGLQMVDHPPIVFSGFAAHIIPLVPVRKLQQCLRPQLLITQADRINEVRQ